MRRVQAKTNDDFSLPIKIPQKIKRENLIKIVPLSENQQKAFDNWKSNKNLILDGVPGSGKTLIGSYLALNDILDPSTPYKKLYIVRSVVSVRDIGHLPGDIDEKQQIYELPYKEIFKKLFGFSDAWQKLKSQDLSEFLITSFLRGITLENCIILLDEMQNCNYQELLSIVTRVGENCKIIISGDYFQSDLHGKEKEEVLKFLKILDRMDLFSRVTFEISDVVRSNFVKQFLIAEKKS